MLPIHSFFFSPVQESPPSISNDIADIQQAAFNALSAVKSLFSAMGEWAVPRTFLPFVETTLSYAASMGYAVTFCIALAGFTNLSIIVCLLSTTTLIGVGVTKLATSQQGLSENIETFEEQNGQLKESIGNLSQEVKTLSSTNTELKQTQNDLNQTNQDLQETNRSLSSEVSAFSEQNHRLAQQVSTLEMIKHGFAQQLTTMRQEVTTLGKHNETLRQETATFGKHNEELQRSLQTLGDRLNAVGKLNEIFSQLAQDTKQVLTQEGSQIEELLKLFSVQIDHFKKQCDTLTEQHQVDASSQANFLAELKQLMDASVLSKRLSELSSITQQIREATKSHLEVEGKITTAARTLAKFEGQIEERDATLSKTKQELEEIFQQMRDERKRLSEVRRELEDLIAKTKPYKENANG